MIVLCMIIGERIRNVAFITGCVYNVIIYTQPAVPSTIVWMITILCTHKFFEISPRRVLNIFIKLVICRRHNSTSVHSYYRCYICVTVLSIARQAWRAWSLYGIRIKLINFYDTVWQPNKFSQRRFGLLYRNILFCPIYQICKTLRNIFNHKNSTISPCIILLLLYVSVVNVTHRSRCRRYKNKRMSGKPLPRASSDTTGNVAEDKTRMDYSRGKIKRWCTPGIHYFGRIRERNMYFKEQGH